MLIYIVDDNLEVCEFIAFVLINEGYAVHVFACPLEALDHMKHNSICPAILITDYNMPKMNGFELHQAVNTHAPMVKTIVISGRCVQGLIGDLHFIHKPFAPDQLLKLIDAVKYSAD